VTNTIKPSDTAEKKNHRVWATSPFTGWFVLIGNGNEWKILPLLCIAAV